jgi:1-acyl-sn-glycerol-3-phosphate acyltransferase
MGVGGFLGENTAFLYFLTVRLIRTGLSIFFQKIEVRHGENIPRQGPLIIAANHPNSTMDALLMSSVTKRMIHHIGHAGLFRHRFKAWLLRNFGVIPVRRRRSLSESPHRNVDSFESCYEVLEKGGAISIFPEGISDPQRKVKKIKTGAARIILEAERRNGYDLGVTLIPIGLHFFSRSRFRSRVLVNVGREIQLAPFFKLNEKDNAEAVIRLTDELQERLEHLTINIPHPKLEELVKDLETIYRDELKGAPSHSGKAPKRSVEEFVLSQKIAECVEYYYRHNPPLVWDMQAKIDRYKRILRRFHLKDAMLREKTSISGILKMELVNIVKALPGLPFAAYGILSNYLPYRITEDIAKKYMAERTKILTALFLGGGVVFLLFYAAQVAVVWVLRGPLWSGAYFLSLPLSGFFALAYTKRFRMEWKRLGYAFFLFTKRHLVGKMRYSRKKLIAELDNIKKEYLSLDRNETGPAE